MSGSMEAEVVEEEGVAGGPCLLVVLGYRE